VSRSDVFALAVAALGIGATSLVSSHWNWLFALVGVVCSIVYFVMKRRRTRNSRTQPAIVQKSHGDATTNIVATGGSTVNFASAPSSAKERGAGAPPRVLMDFVAAAQYSSFRLRSASEHYVFDIVVQRVYGQDGSTFIEWEAIPSLAPGEYAQPSHTVFTTDGKHSNAGVFLRRATQDRAVGLFETVIKYRDSKDKYWETPCMITYERATTRISVECGQPTLGTPIPPLRGTYS